jgi:uncharacterized protein YceK
VGKISVALIVCLLLVTTGACGSVGTRKVHEDQKGVMYGMVYDRENNPMSGVRLYIDGEIAGETDIQGRFLLEFKGKDRCLLSLDKKGFEPVQREVLYDPTGLLYFKLTSAAQLLSEGEKALEIRDYANALSFVDRALVLEPYRTDALYLRSIILMGTKQYEEALSILNSIDNPGRSGPYIEMTKKRIGELLHENP